MISGYFWIKSEIPYKLEKIFKKVIFSVGHPISTRWSIAITIDPPVANIGSKTIILLLYIF